MITALPAPGRGDDTALALPTGVRAVWDLERAYHDTTPTRERICINGLWRWQPAEPLEREVPAGHWGYFKVPGCWPGITDYLQKDCQTLYEHPEWKGRDLRGLSAAWYQREVRIPDAWKGRRVCLAVELVNSLAAVFVDEHPAGEIRFPGGALELPEALADGRTHVLSLLVVAAPLKAVMLSYLDTASARSVRGTVPRRGLCGDVFLVATPRQARIEQVLVNTSVRGQSLTVTARLEGLEPGERYVLRARVAGRHSDTIELASNPFGAADLQDGRITYPSRYRPQAMWDLDTPENQEVLSLSLLDARGQVRDTFFDQRFGFRELWIDGRDFYLNGTRLFLSAVPIDNALISAGAATYEAARDAPAAQEPGYQLCVHAQL